MNGAPRSTPLCDGGCCLTMPGEPAPDLLQRSSIFDGISLQLRDGEPTDWDAPELLRRPPLVKALSL